jgi:bifunctional non-homologous end joining protein LigD
VAGDPPLGEYRRKRDPDRTPEPVPASDDLPQGNDDTFVIQEHHARALHWDFRLERDGVLVSWAVPKGLPEHPKDNHLAVHTEDHPLEYAAFAGDIPAGEYGGGRVLLWDHGRYETEKWSDREVMVVLHGQRVQGKYVLFRTGRSGRDWMIHRMDPPRRADWERLPESVPPMQAVPGRLPAARADGEWAYEFDWGGMRAVAYIEGGRLRLVADPRDVDVTRAFPELRELGASLGATPVVLDGELVCLGADGHPDPERLRRRLESAGPSVTAAKAARQARQTPVTYLVTDLLHLDGRSVVELPYRDRRGLLEDLDLHGPAWRLPPSFTGGGRDVLAAAAENGLPGVVAKRRASPYRPGEQSRDWRRVTG